MKRSPQRPRSRSSFGNPGTAAGFDKLVRSATDRSTASRVRSLGRLIGDVAYIVGYDTKFNSRGTLRHPRVVKTPKRRRNG